MNLVSTQYNETIKDIIELTLIQNLINIESFLKKNRKKKIKNKKNIRRKKYMKNFMSGSEILLIQVTCLNLGIQNLKAMHNFICSFLSSAFPHLPGYKRFVERCNSLSGFLEECLQNEGIESVVNQENMAVDSMPIIIAQSCRSSKAKSAQGTANKGYSSSKKMYYYGVKLHLFVGADENRKPYIYGYFEITEASEHDINFLKRNYNQLSNVNLYADLAYKSRELEENMTKGNNQLITPPKKNKNQKNLTPQQRKKYEEVSKIRQVVESTFASLASAYNIAKASLVRSVKGLKRHICTRILASKIASLV